MKVEGKIIVCTGGCSGLGEATVKELIGQGAYVGVLDIDQRAGDQLENTFQDRVVFCKCDVTSEEEVSQALETLVSRWPEHKLAGVVNCAGTGVPAPLINSDGSPHALALFKKHIELNLVGTFNVTRLVASHIVRSYPKPGRPLPLSATEEVPEERPGAVNDDRGCLILVSSQTATDALAGISAYAASKGGVSSLALPLARDLSRYGIRVVAIEPSLFATPLSKTIPSLVRRAQLEQTEYPPRLGRPEELARLVVSIFENEMLNGAVIPLNGASRPSRISSL